MQYLGLHYCVWNTGEVLEVFPIIPPRERCCCKISWSVHWFCHHPHPLNPILNNCFHWTKLNLSFWICYCGFSSLSESKKKIPTKEKGKIIMEWVEEKKLNCFHWELNSEWTHVSIRFHSLYACSFWVLKLSFWIICRSWNSSFCPRSVWSVACHYNVVAFDRGSKMVVCDGNFSWSKAPSFLVVILVFDGHP